MFSFAMVAINREALTTALNPSVCFYFKDGTKFTIDLICELLDSDEAINEYLKANGEVCVLEPKYWANFIRKHCN